MEFVPIFAKENPALFAFKRVGAKTDVLTNLFLDWNNTSYLWNYFNKYSKFLGKWGDQEELIESAANKTIIEANSLNTKLINLSHNYQNDKNAIQLDSMFRKLHNGDNDESELLESKAYGINDPRWLRIYGIKIESNCYLITGGMIKLTNSMQDMGKVGMNEIKNIKSVKAYLKSSGINDKKSLIKYIDDKAEK